MQQQLVGHFCNDSEYVVGIVPRDITCCFHFLTSMRSFTADRNGTIKLQGLWRRTACGVVLPVHLLGTSCTQLSRHTPGLREEPQHTAWRKRSWDICGLSQNSVDTNSLVTRSSSWQIQHQDPPYVSKISVFRGICCRKKAAHDLEKVSSRR